MGFSVSSTNGIANVSASTSVASLLATVLVIVAYLLALDPQPRAYPDSSASTLHRAIAWFLDFFLSLLALTSILAFLPLGKEALTTGHFRWEFARTYATASDWLLDLLLVALTFAGMAAYWTIPVFRHGQTIGQAIVGIKVFPTVGEPRVGRVFLRGLCQPFAPLLWIGKLISVSGHYWHDDLAAVKVLRIVPEDRRAAT